MAAITISSLSTEDMPPVGVIEADDTFTAVIPLDDVCLFVAVESPMRYVLADTLTLLAEFCRQSPESATELDAEVLPVNG